MTLVLGIDPGTRITGYGAVIKEGGRLTLVEAGCITASPRLPLPQRLKEIHDGVAELMVRHAPDAVAVEDIFFARNVKSAVALGHVRGVILLAAAAAGRPIHEYPPASIKLSLVGYGRAEKDQVGLMVCHILNLDGGLKPDAADALAAAICHLHQTPALTREAAQ